MESKIAMNPLAGTTLPRESAIAYLLDRLDRLEGEAGHCRQHPRFPFRRSGVPLTLKHPGGTQSSFLVWTRNLSQSGVGLLLESFVHPGSHCRIDLPNSDGGAKPLFGQVRWCRLLTANVHEIGVNFTEPIELDLYLEAAVLEGADNHDPPVTNEHRDLIIEEISLHGEALLKIVERPNLKSARATCKTLVELSERIDARALELAARKTLAELERSGSVSRSEHHLRRVSTLAQRCASLHSESR